MKKIDYYYNKGKLIIDGIEGFSMPVDTFALLNKSITEINETLMYDVGEAQGKSLEVLMPKNEIPLADKIRLCVDKINSFGFGLLELKHMSKDNFTFKLDSSIAKSHKKNFGISKYDVDLFTCGLLTGIMEKAFNQRYIGKELICSAKGKPYCVLEIKKIN